jgi:hypothetical protein
MSRLLITNGGTHPPEKWALTTAEMIFPVADSALVGDHLIAAQRFQLDLAEALVPHHAAVASMEKDKLASVDDHSATSYELAEHPADVVKHVSQLAKGTPWEAHFADPEVLKAVLDVVQDHFASSLHVERLFYADNHPDNAAAQAYAKSFK